MEESVHHLKDRHDISWREGFYHLNDIKESNVFIVGVPRSGKSSLLKYIFDGAMGKLDNKQQGVSAPTEKIIKVKKEECSNSDYYDGSKLKLNNRQQSKNIWTEQLTIFRGIIPDINLNISVIKGFKSDSSNDPKGKCHKSEIIQKFFCKGSISCIIICISDWRLTEEVKEMIQFYSELQKYLFLNGNIIILRTKVGQNEYNQLTDKKRLHDIKYKYLKSLRGSVLRCDNIHFIDIINTDNYNHVPKYTTLLNHYRNGMIFKYNVFKHSLGLRENIMEYIRKCVPHYTLSHYHSFRLPRSIEDKRIEHLKILKDEFYTEMKKIEKICGPIDSFKKLVSLCFDLTSAKKNIIECLLSDISELSYPVIVYKSFFVGDNFKDRKPRHIVLNGGDGYKIPHDKWIFKNCDCIVKNYNDNNKIEFQIIPHAFSRIRDGWPKKYEWFANVWLEKKGEKYNSKIIKKKQNTIIDTKMKLDHLNTEKKKIIKTLKQKTEYAYGCKNIFNIIESEELNILSMEVFNSKDINSLMDILYN